VEIYTSSQPIFWRDLGSLNKISQDTNQTRYWSNCSKGTFEELQTLFARVEACLNSKPLTSISFDESTPLILTPGHFLIRAPITTPPETNYGPNPMIHQPKNRWKHLQLMMSHFWKTWSQQYLHSLQTRQKWNSHTSNPKPGDIVLMMDNNNPPLSWKIGIIKTLHPGNDGVVRVATI